LETHIKTKKRIKIGIPRALLFHKYETLWKTFFNDLDCDVVYSPPTNKLILDKGVNFSVDESCLPLKIYLGHVNDIKDRCDYVLVPRLASLKKGESACTKFNATCDIVNNTFPGIKILDYNIDVEEGFFEKNEFIRIGKEICFDCKEEKIKKAYFEAKKVQEHLEKENYKKQIKLLEDRTEGTKILVVSHPYNIYDELIGKPILKHLKRLDVTVIMADLFDKEEAMLLSDKISSRLYWTYNKELLGALEFFRIKVNGVIFIVTFPCGPDSLVTDLCIRKLKGLPMMTLVLDELQSEAGVKTRIESFVDILEMRERKKHARK